MSEVPSTNGEISRLETAPQRDNDKSATRPAARLVIPTTKIAVDQGISKMSDTWWHVCPPARLDTSIEEWTR